MSDIQHLYCIILGAWTFPISGDVYYHPYKHTERITGTAGRKRNVWSVRGVLDKSQAKTWKFRHQAEKALIALLREYPQAHIERIGEYNE